MLLWLKAILLPGAIKIGGLIQQVVGSKSGRGHPDI